MHEAFDYSNRVHEETGMTGNNDEAAAPEQCARPLAIRGIREKEALARFAGDEKRYRHWLNEFVSHGPAATAQIRDALAHGTPDAALGLVHTLKGRTGMLGMVELHSIAFSLEQSLKNREPTAFWLEELERTVAEMSQEITASLKDPDD